MGRTLYKEERAMMEYRLISIQVGVLFIVATVLAVIGFVFWMPLEEASYP